MVSSKENMASIEVEGLARKDGGESIGGARGVEGG